MFNESGTLMGLPFFVPGEEVCITEYWRRGEAQIWYFYIMSHTNQVVFLSNLKKNKHLSVNLDINRLSVAI